MLRRSLVWMLAIALMVAGMPMAHAQNCDTTHAKSGHHEMHMSAAEAAAMDHASPQHDESPVATCKCLNCSSVCAAYVAPVLEAISLHRRIATIVYVFGETPRTEAVIFIDPGIPIAA